MHRNSSDIFCLREVDTKKEGSDQIYSVGGSPSVRINRRNNVLSNVYPYGPATLKVDEQKLDAKCDKMSTTMELDEPSSPIILARDDEHSEDDIPVSPLSVASAPSSAYAMRRNPLTGEGMESELQRTGKRRVRGKRSNWVW